MHSSSATMRQGSLRTNNPQELLPACCCMYCDIRAGVRTIYSGSGSLVLRLRLARQEHGDACNDSEDGEANWQVFESDHGQTFLALVGAVVGQYGDVALQYRTLKPINKLYVHDVCDNFKLYRCRSRFSDIDAANIPAATKYICDLRHCHHCNPQINSSFFQMTTLSACCSVVYDHPCHSTFAK